MRRDAAERGVEQLDRVQRGKGPPGAPEGLRDLDEAARVRARVDVGAGREHVPCLAVAELAGGLRLDDVVDPGRAAAEILLGRLDDASGRGFARARGRQAAGSRCAWRRWHESWYATDELERWSVREIGARERLGDVERREAAVLQVRAAPGRVDDDRVEAVRGSAQPLGQPARLLGAPRVGRERAAAALARRDDVVAGGGQHARGGRVDVAEARPTGRTR